MNDVETPESVTTERSYTTTSPSPESSWDHLLWIPYVVLTFILILLTCVSFMHYHYKNRGKYLGAIYKHNNVTSCPRKYRVTLNRKGFVAGTLFSNHRNLMNSRGVGMTGSDITKHDIFIVSNADCCRPELANGGGRSPATGSLPCTRTSHNYENEAYDRDSSHGSDESLPNVRPDVTARADIILDPDRDIRDVIDIAKHSVDSAFRPIGAGRRSRDALSDSSSGSAMFQDLKPSSVYQTEQDSRTENSLSLRENNENTTKTMSTDMFG